MALRDNIIKLIDDLALDADHWSDDMIDYVETLCADRKVPDDGWLATDHRMAVYCVYQAVRDAGDAPSPVRAECEWIDPIWGHRTAGCNPGRGYAQVVDTEPAVGAWIDLNDRTNWVITWCIKTLSARPTSGEGVDVWRLDISSGGTAAELVVAVLHDGD